MSEDAPVLSEADEELLDDVYERVVAAFEEGDCPRAEDWVAGRSYLIPRVTELIETARGMSRGASRPLPSVRGFTLVRELGRGGMGVVYLARQEALGGREVALKVVSTSVALSSNAHERFVREARALGRLRHPNIVTVYDVITDAGACAYAMEWIDGMPLAQVIDRLAVRATSGAVQPTGEDVLEILGGGERHSPSAYPIFIARLGVAIGRALASAHRAGFVHRDVKPSNILLRRNGTPLLTDFGLVHAADQDITWSGQFVGTLAYSSPEQLAGDSDRLDPRSDVYSLGVTLFQALTLHLPFGERGKTLTRPRTPVAMLQRVERGLLDPLTAWGSRLPPDLETILAKAMAFDAAGRYASADELADDLQRMLDLQPIRARRAGVLVRAAKLVRRHRTAALGLAVGALTAVALAALLVIQFFLIPQQQAARRRQAVVELREARLDLLNPAFSPSVLLGSYWAVGDLQPRASDGRPVVSRRLAVRREALERARQHYRDALSLLDAADDSSLLRDTVRSECNVIEVALEGRAWAATADSRLEWLHGYVTGDARGVLAAWTRYESARSTSPRDPLIGAAMGVFGLGDGRSDAYELLDAAAQDFADVGFVAVYLAEAALKRGLLARAELLLDEAERMPDRDGIMTHERVRADLLARLGRHAEAERLYATIPGARAKLNYADLLESQQRWKEALAQVEAALLDAPSEVAITTRYTAAAQSWWASLSVAERGELLERSLDTSPLAVESLTLRAARYLACCRAIDPDARTSGRDFEAATAPVPAQSLLSIAREIATLSACALVPSLQVADFSSVSLTLEVAEMIRCSTLWPRPRSIADLRVLSWLAQSPRLAAKFRRGAIPLAAGALASASLSQTPSFVGVGDLPGGAFKSAVTVVSADGTTVVGWSEVGTSGAREAFRWRAGVMDPLGDLPLGPLQSAAKGVNFDGSVIVGEGTGASGQIRAVRWDGTTIRELPQVPGYSGSDCIHVSADGRVLHGRALTGSGWQAAVPFRIVDGVLTTLSLPAGYTHGEVQGSAGTGDGSAVPGVVAMDSFQSSRAAYWVNGAFQMLPSLPGGLYSSCSAISGDGRVQVGNSSSAAFQSNHYEPCRWVNGVAQALGSTFVAAAGAEGSAESCTYDGSVIVGWAGAWNNPRAWVWDAQHGMRWLDDVLTNDYGLNLAGWSLTVARSITPDGSVIVGTGRNPAGDTEGWIARLATPSAATYCTSSTTSSGCAPKLASYGFARASGAGDCTLLAFDVEGQRSGMFFYGLAPTATPWHVQSSSWLCVVSPRIRTTALNSGGTSGACDGALQLSWSDWLAANPAAFGAPYAPGQQLYAQAWFRDPPAVNGMNLSNALSWTVQF